MPAPQAPCCQQRHCDREHSDSDNAGGGQGGGVDEEAGVITLNDSIVAGKSDLSGQTPDCDGGPTSAGANVMGNTVGCGFSLGTGDVATTAPKLGGARQQRRPDEDRVAAEGKPGIEPRLELRCQRPARRARSLAGKCDSGAYERVTCGGVLVNRVGTSGKDTLTGTGIADGMLGLGGNDTLRVSAPTTASAAARATKKLFGGKGKDRLLGQAGKDMSTAAQRTTAVTADRVETRSRSAERARKGEVALESVLSLG